jgi:NitT/TauT family transport system permease protein
LEIAALFICIIIWEFVADFVIKKEFLLPSFFTVALAFSRSLSSGILLGDILTSLFHLGIGLAIAICIGIPIGALTGWFRIADRIADPIIEILRPIPPLAWIPFALVWLHLTHYAAGFIVFIGAIFPILVNTHAGFRNVPKVLVESAEVLGCTKDRNLIKAVALPSALPFITTGIRIGTGVGWMCVVAAEYFGVSTSGLGYRIWQKFYFLHQMDNLLVYMIVLGLIALLIDRSFRFFAEKKLLKWHKGIVA